MSHSSSDATPPGTVLPAGKLPADLLARLIEAYRTPPEPSVLVGPGIGSDAAAIAVGGTTLVVKTDPITFATEDAARYLVNVNANDVACLGARPKWLLVVALLPEGMTTPETVEAQFAELHAVCLEHGIAAIGGHTEITVGLDRPILVGTLLGEVAAEHLLRPGGARPGDDLLLTKAIALEGTALLARELRDRLVPELGEEVVRQAAKLLYRPGISVVADAMALLDGGGVTALHDPTEGGLATGVHELAGVAGCGAELLLDAIPILPETRLFADNLGLDPLGLLASGSLLATVSPDRLDDAMAAARRGGVQVTRIGRMVDAGEGLSMIGAGGRQPLPHFAVDEITRVL